MKILKVKEWVERKKIQFFMTENKQRACRIKDSQVFICGTYATMVSDWFYELIRFDDDRIHVYLRMYDSINDAYLSEVKVSINRLVYNNTNHVLIIKYEDS